jgi:branched-chain amino acid transport system ATP-binding protein
VNGLSIENLQSGYGNLQVLWGISLAIPFGSVVAILGPNGSGKSTMMATIAGTLPASSGHLEMDGVDLLAQSYSRRVRSGIGWVPQGRHIFDRLSVLDNLVVSVGRRERPHLSQRLETVFALFPVLKAKRKAAAGSLSGGEQQMLAIARALVKMPRVLLLDEPTTGLAPIILDSLVSSLGHMKNLGTAILVAEQNPAWLAPVVDEVRFMLGGRLSSPASLEIVSSREEIRRSYLEGI